MKIFEAENLAMSLQTMLETKGVVGYKIARNLRMINDELKDYYQFKQTLFEKYGELAEDGNLIIKKDSANYQDFLKEYEPVMNQEVEFDFKKITEEEFENGDLTAEQILILSEYFGE